MNIHLKSLALFLLIPFTTHCHKTVFLISPPRSLSVAFLRMMDACNYFIILNEPFISAFGMSIESERELTQGWWKENAPDTYEKAEEVVLAHMTQSPVFIKEIAFVIDEYLQKPNPFIGNPEVEFIFLVRNPHHMLCSYYKSLGTIVENFCYLASYEQLYRLYTLVNAHHPNKPLVILSEDLYTNPKHTAQRVCTHIGIPFKDSMLHWENLDSSFNGQQWHDLKVDSWIEKWHGDAMHSTGISKPRTYETDANGNPTFSEIKNDADRVEVWDTYKRNKLFYDLLISGTNPYRDYNIICLAQ